MDLKKHTLIAEYLGDVISTEDYLLSKDTRECGTNSRFTLLKTNSKSTSLEIVPEFNANIARFLNSANFDEKDAKKRKFKNNVSVSRVAIEGAVTAIMFTNRIVKANEEL